MLTYEFGDQINAKLSYASDMTSSHSKCDLSGIEKAGKEKLLILKPKAHSFYITNIPHYEPRLTENSRNFWFICNPKP